MKLKIAAWAGWALALVLVFGGLRFGTDVPAVGGMGKIIAPAFDQFATYGDIPEPTPIPPCAVGVRLVTEAGTDFQVLPNGRTFMLCMNEQNRPVEILSQTEQWALLRPGIEMPGWFRIADRIWLENGKCYATYYETNGVTARMSMDGERVEWEPSGTTGICYIMSSPGRVVPVTDEEQIRAERAALTTPSQR